MLTSESYVVSIQERYEPIVLLFHQKEPFEQIHVCSLLMGIYISHLKATAVKLKITNDSNKY